MENSSTAATYGAPFSDETAVTDPTTQISSEQFNKILLHLAQLTRTAHKIYVEFPTVASGSTTPTLTRTIWGDTSSYYPTSVARTGVGTYLVSYPGSFSDDFGDSENMKFSHGHACVVSSTVGGTCQVTCSGPNVTIKTLDAGSIDDLTNGTTIGLYLYL